jgi:hypothetical protein
MRLYSIEGKRRWAIGVGILLLAHTIVVSSYILLKKYPSFKEALEISEGWIGYFELADFGLLAAAIYFSYWLFDRHIWGMSFFQNLLSVPNLNGEWIGTLNRKEFPSEEEEVSLPVFIIIKQTYFKMSVKLHNILPDSLSGISVSDTAVIGIENDSSDNFQINLMFENKKASVFGANTLVLSQERGVELLQGNYVSSVPRIGEVLVFKVEKNRKIEIGKIKQMKDTDDNIYYGVPISPNLITSFEKVLRNRFNTETTSKLFANRQNRDGFGYHMTIIAPHEVSQLSSEQLKKLDNGGEISFVLQKVGEAIRNDCSAYFITVHSPHGDYIREELGLPRKDFHITLGFNPNDIHDHEKDDTTWMLGQ